MPAKGELRLHTQIRGLTALRALRVYNHLKVFKDSLNTYKTELGLLLASLKQWKEISWGQHCPSQRLKW